MNQRNVLVTATRFDELCVDSHTRLRDAGLNVILNPYNRPFTFDELLPHLPDVDAVIAGVDDWDEAVFEKAPRLKVVTRFGVGVDNFDLASATRHGVQMGNAPGGNAQAVAEMTVAGVLCALRDVVELQAAAQRAEWPRAVGRELRGRTIGLLGFGAIGRAVAQLFTGFGAEMLAFDAYPDTQTAARLGVQLVSAEELLARSDVVCVHLPALPETRRFINAERLAAMKPGVVVVNMARGVLVDSQALRAAVDSGQVAAAVVDVYEHEPVQADDPLLGSPHILAFPHTAAETEETYTRIGRISADAVLDALAGKRIAHPVNDVPGLTPQQ